MTNYNDGKIHGWNGGDCPVHPLTIVKPYFRRMHSKNDYEAYHLRWLHQDAFCDDVVAFQVVKEYKEPMVIWVNIYKNGFSPVYESEKEALDSAVYAVVRSAVKFIEVK